jgi:hypothetical protein
MRKIVVGIAVGVIGIAGYAVGRPTFSSLGVVPNLSNVPGISTQCQSCHVGSGGGVLNLFGETVEANLVGGVPDWSQIFKIDSDGDGYSNGQELGDPYGWWRSGQPNPGLASKITNPGDRASKPTGPSSVKIVTTPTAWGVIKALFR